VRVEALAAGKPVIACREGGAPDIVRPGLTGLLVDPTVEDLRAALDRLPTLSFDPARLQAEARRFDKAVFERRFTRAIDRAWRERHGGAPDVRAPGVRPSVEATT
jgi:glycosyltransferase involved in cell wall biosynthesis